MTAHTLGTLALELAGDCSRPASRRVHGGETCGLVNVCEGDVSVLARRGGLSRQGSHAAPLSPGRRWSSLAGLLLRMNGPISRPCGCSETGHFGYGPLTGGTSFLTLYLRTCSGSPCERASQGLLCPRRTTPCKSTRHSVAWWWCPALHRHKAMV